MEKYLLIVFILAILSISLQIFNYFFPTLISEKIADSQVFLRKKLCLNSNTKLVSEMEEKCETEKKSVKQVYDSEIEKIKNDLQTEINSCKSELQNSVSTGSITSEQASKAYEQKILELQGNFEKEKIELQKAADTLLNQAVESKTACELNVAALNQKIKELESKLIV